MTVVRSILATVLLTGFVAGSPAVAEPARVAGWVVEQLQEARAGAGSAVLEQRPELDAVALERARTIAGLPHKQRLSYEQPIGDQLRVSGTKWFSRAAAHLDMVRGYVRPEIGILRSWQHYDDAWNKALAPDYTAIGAATARGEDGWVVFVAVLIVDLLIPEDPLQLEKAVIEAVNRERTERGLARLIRSPELSAVARGHCEDMIRREFIAHVNPDGMGTAERVDLAGIYFAKLGENVHMNRGAADPISFAIERWLGSPGHRKTMLDPDYVQTGVGAAMADDGRIFLTQLFMVPGPTR
jgi:uncharacterized protein YkwD